MSTGWRKEVDVGKDKKEPKDLAPKGEDAAAIKGGKVRPGSKRPLARKPGMRKA